MSCAAVIFASSCQKPRPIINEHEAFVGVWKYQGVEDFFSPPGSSGDYMHAVVENEFVEQGTRLTISSDGRFLIETNEDAIYNGKIMNVGIAAGKAQYIPGVVLRPTCFHIDPPIGQLSKICAIIHDGNLKTPQIPYEVTGVPPTSYRIQIFQKQ